MSHTCQALVLACIDFRFHDKLNQWLNDKGLKDNADQVKIAGGVLSIIKPTEMRDRDFLLHQLGISVSLHEIKQVYLINHEDCGAYGGKKSFASDAEELEKHIIDMRDAKKIILEKFPQLEVKLIFATIKYPDEHGTPEIGFVEVE